MIGLFHIFASKAAGSVTTEHAGPMNRSTFLKATIPRRPFSGSHELSKISYVMLCPDSRVESFMTSVVAIGTAAAVRVPIGQRPVIGNNAPTRISGSERQRKTFTVITNLVISKYYLYSRYPVS